LTVGVVVGDIVDTMVGVKLQSVLFVEPKKMSVGEVIIVPNQ
jgi:hypothetical protein